MMKLLHVGKLNGGKALQPKVVGCDCPLNKPSGKDIIWASPLESNYGWKEWCAYEGERIGLVELDDIPQEVRWILELDEGARVAKVDNSDDLQALVARFPLNDHSLDHSFSTKELDWQNLARSYDAFWLTEKGQEETLFSNPRLTGWDCETVVVFNAAIVKVVK